MNEILLMCLCGDAKKIIFVIVVCLLGWLVVCVSSVLLLCIIIVLFFIIDILRNAPFPHALCLSLFRRCFVPEFSAPV